jgi:hypothetical protein
MEIGGIQPLAVFAGDEGRPPGARVVAAARTLDLDDVGPEVCERLPGPGSGKDAGEFDDFQAGQRFQGAPLLKKPIRLPACLSDGQKRGKANRTLRRVKLASRKV